MREKRKLLFIVMMVVAMSFFAGCGTKVAAVNQEITEEVTTEEETTTAIPPLVPELKAVAEEYENPHVDGTPVYLTFDDGPSYLTNNVLDILDEYDVRATFFVVYRGDEELIPCYKRIVNSGHTIGVHTASHNYDKIYSSFEAFTSDFDKVYNYVKELTGVSCKVSRFPGGSATKQNKGIRAAAKEWLAASGITYHDWNLITGDGFDVTAEEEIRNVLESVAKRSHPVILAHDGIKKEATVEALPVIISTLKDWGYTFEPITEDTCPVQQGVNW